MGTTHPMVETPASREITYAYEPLSSEDRMFLLCERRDVHMHVAATLIFDGPPARSGRAARRRMRIVRYVESRLDLVPRYRQRLRATPLTGNPVWVGRRPLRRLVPRAPRGAGAAG